jgi:hypothetical protein
MKPQDSVGSLNDGKDPATSRTSGNEASGETPFKQMNSLNSWKTMTSVHKAITSEAFIESQKLSPGYWQETETKSCCGCVKRNAKPKPFSQTLVVLRPSERLDQMDPEGYKESEMGKVWPWDGPLTKAGNDLADKVAVELAALHKQVGVRRTSWLTPWFGFHARSLASVEHELLALMATKSWSIARLTRLTRQLVGKGMSQPGRYDLFSISTSRMELLIAQSWSS